MFSQICHRFTIVNICNILGSWVHPGEYASSGEKKGLIYYSYCVFTNIMFHVCMIGRLEFEISDLYVRSFGENAVSDA